jgi:hypothetical protein
VGLRLHGVATGGIGGSFVLLPIPQDFVVLGVRLGVFCMSFARAFLLSEGLYIFVESRDLT